MFNFNFFFFALFIRYAINKNFVSSLVHTRRLIIIIIYLFNVRRPIAAKKLICFCFRRIQSGQPILSASGVHFFLSWVLFNDVEAFKNKYYNRTIFSHSVYDRAQTRGQKQPSRVCQTARYFLETRGQRKQLLNEKN